MRKNEFGISKIYIIMFFVFVGVMLNIELVFSILGEVLALLRPIFIGVFIAFVLNRPICIIYKMYCKLNLQDLATIKSAGARFTHFGKIAVVSNEKRVDKRWVFAVITAYLLLLLIIVGILLIVVPELQNSISKLSENFDEYSVKLRSYYRILLENDQFGAVEFLTKYAEKLSSEIPNVIAKVYDRTADFFLKMTDTIIGIVISIYILASRNSIRKAVIKVAKRITSNKAYENISDIYKIVYDVFTKFVTGQISEALILGVLCFAGMTLFRFEYPLLISTIIGVTALFPVVGAFIGTVPSALLLFLEEPSSAIWFVIFIIVLQQLENNFIYPKIVGKSIGLHPLAVFIAILIGAKLAGAVGILLAVPLFAISHEIIRKYS